MDIVRSYMDIVQVQTLDSLFVFLFVCLFLRTN